MGWVKGEFIRSGQGYFTSEDIVYGEAPENHEDSRSAWMYYPDNLLCRPPFNLTCPFPLANASYRVRKEGLVHQTVGACELWRLNRVRQLASLHTPVIAAIGQTNYKVKRFDHSRLLHSLDVCAVMNLMLSNNHVDADTRRHGKVAALVHDKLTPAHGDAVKLIDPAGFDEDKNIRQAFAGSKFDDFRTRHKLDVDLLVETIQGRGLLGTLLNFADKISYVARDLQAFLAHCIPGQASPEQYREYMELALFLSSHPDACSVWDCVEIRGCEAFFTDASRLANFLRARAMAFRNIYRNPATRFMEVMFDRVVVGHAYRCGQITREQLLSFTDCELDAVVAKVVGHQGLYEDLSCIGRPFVETFSSVSDARQRELELMSEGKVFTLFDLIGNIGLGVDLPVRNSRGVLTALADVMPGISQEVRRLLGLDRSVRLYCIANPNLKPTYMEPFFQYRDHQLKMIEEA